ncbi:uncharacterized protein [Panulirus ornatus]|uniref:uncharacterized protein n=1 Tax=Panulirus ornatus TaxID=150431 RepID=UPI003A8BE434
MRVAGTRGRRRVVSLLLVLLLAHLLLLLLLLLLLRRDQLAPPAAAAAAGGDAASAAPPALPHTRFLGSPSRQESPCVGVGGGRPSAWQPVYTVVIDAGATATRAHVFSFLRCCIDNTFLLQKEDYFHVDDSILHYVNTPHQIRGLLLPLLRQAREVVPEEYLKHTPLILRATPSLRRLPRTHATRLIHRARNVASRTAFLVRRDHVTIMAGHDEAADLWLAANFLTGESPVAVTLIRDCDYDSVAITVTVALAITVTVTVVVIVAMAITVTVTVTVSVAVAMAVSVAVSFSFT